MNHETKKKLNNKGFSLMELIIVVAIMAVLIGVLAPQYLKYVDKSKESADLQTIDTLISAVEIYSADPDNSIVTGDLKCASNGEITAENEAVLAALKEAGLAGTSALTTTPIATLKSSKYSKEWKISFSADGVTTGNSDLATGLAIGLVSAEGTEVGGSGESTPTE